jgi:DNA-binding HxlR family transcriptional regulator
MSEFLDKNVTSRVVLRRETPRLVMKKIGDKWSTRVLLKIAASPIRFNELRRSIAPISTRVLAATLRDLEEVGFVQRKAIPTSPPSVEYSLTELGRSFLAIVHSVLLWIDANIEHIDSARADYRGQANDDRDLD